MKKLIKAIVLSMTLSMVPVAAVQAETPKTEATTVKAYTGWKVVNGYRYYYRNGKKLTGWQKIGSYTYKFNSSGQAAIGLKKISGYYYYFDKYGRMQKGWKTINGYKYYFLSNGKACTSTRTMNGYKYYFYSNGRYYRRSNISVRRAVCIGESNYRYANDLSACYYDAKAMKNMLKKTGYSTVGSYYDCTKSAIKSKINSILGDADSNDVSLFYYSGHGASDGSLYTVEGGYISTYELTNWLKAIPGKVIVILDSCYSGQVIGKSMDKAVEDFNTSVINAFAKADVQAKSGEMCTSKFYVLTASRGNQTSGCYSTYSLFTEKLISGVGYDYFSGSRRSSAPADRNNNKKLSLDECRYYTFMNIYSQDAQGYPYGSDYTLFKR